MYTIRERCYQSLLQWHGEQHQHFLGPANRDLFDRVTKVLQAERLDHNGTPEAELVTLVQEVRGTRPVSIQATMVEQLDEEAVRIVRTLYDTHPRLRIVPEIAAGADVSPGTAKQRVRALIESGYVHRPNGDNRGAGLTAKGIELAAMLPPAEP